MMLDIVLLSISVPGDHVKYVGFFSGLVLLQIMSPKQPFLSASKMPDSWSEPLVVINLINLKIGLEIDYDLFQNIIQSFNSCNYCVCIPYNFHGYS